MNKRTQDSNLHNKYNFTDHDLLILLDAKVDVLSRDVKSIKDGLTERVSKTEMRLDLLEKTAVEYSGAKYVPMIEKNDQWIHDFNVRWKTLWSAAVVIGGIMGVVLTRIFDYFFGLVIGK